MSSRPTDDWTEFFETQGDAFTAQRVFDYWDVLDDPQAPENGYIVEKDIPLAGRHRVVGNPIRVSRTPAVPQPKFPALGEHTEAIMHELGFSSDEIAVIEQQKDLAGVS